MYESYQQGLTQFSGIGMDCTKVYNGKHRQYGITSSNNSNCTSRFSNRQVSRQYYRTALDSQDSRPLTSHPTYSWPRHAWMS